MPVSFCCYDFCEAHWEKYGYLYTLSAVTNTKESPQSYHENFIDSLLSPDGWQIPTLDDWFNLHKMLNDSQGVRPDKYLGGWIEPNVQEVMKSTESWESKLNVQNPLGLNILASGYLSHKGNFMDLGRCAEIWLATVTGPDFDHRHFITLGCNSSHVVPEMASVRLVKKAE